MRASLKKTITGAMAAVVLALGVTASATPASAWGCRGGGCWGPAVGLGIAGLAAGAIIASQRPYGYPGYYGYRGYYGYAGYDDCTRWRPTYDAWGRYVGRRPVNVCY